MQLHELAQLARYVADDASVRVMDGFSDPSEEAEDKRKIAAIYLIANMVDPDSKDEDVQMVTKAQVDYTFSAEDLDDLLGAYVKEVFDVDESELI